MSWFQDAHAAVAGWIFEHALLPLLYAVGLVDWDEDIYGWLDFALFGLLGIALAWLVCRPLEAWRPVEPVTDRRAVRTDMLYTVLTRLGVLPLVAFAALASVQAAWEGWLTEQNLLPPTLEDLLPWLRDHPLLAFACYVVILDFGEYWRHRAQHAFRWWWALHAIHHAQRQMTFWTDDRNHVLDDVLAALWFGGIALLIGVPPGQFPIIVLILRLAESLSHANVRLSYGWLGERLLVSPRFHRLHHGPLSAGASGRNFAVLLPVWDWVFGTADWHRDAFPPTGTPEEPEALATGGWLRQQAVGLRRMVGAIAGR
ncbi:sterol desaturase family protein [Paracraurococcus lichenis]|uniref:Sterol desaturase family protein n=1 Tax=Paracraurococcus lichenis TaxID=3064888 RepID=A0ABT9DVH8_9PROT|nr:sterol desaturase family protein [Paracraurococcus sp. LOR1-02]MDO9707897.1 sterol desaturase family protein [Paracraurococcus sp. LOR1-02]